jgi:hypothetical protein
MALAKLDKARWRAFADLVSKGLVGMRTEIEVASLDLGDQIQAEWLPFLGLVYDPKNDIFEVALEGLDHIIAKPQEVYVDSGATGLISVEIVDADGARHIIKLNEPLMLPPPNAGETTHAPRARPASGH